MAEVELLEEERPEDELFVPPAVGFGMNVTDPEGLPDAIKRAFAEDMPAIMGIDTGLRRFI